MVVNPNFHISQRFISREPGYNIFVLFHSNFVENPSNHHAIENILRRYPSVHYEVRDDIWNRILSDYDYENRPPILLLYYGRILTIIDAQNTIELSFYLDAFIPNNNDD